MSDNHHEIDLITTIRLDNNEIMLRFLQDFDS